MKRNDNENLELDEEYDSNEENYLITYVDLLTLLITFFVILYAMSYS